MTDRVIVPPAQTVADARKRPQEYECQEWWFCHK
jgi:peroxiredoxin (alkyl hydroperoxide reductase subunit C)